MSDVWRSHKGTMLRSQSNVCCHERRNINNQSYVDRQLCNRDKVAVQLTFIRFAVGWLFPPLPVLLALHRLPAADSKSLRTSVLQPWSSWECFALKLTPGLVRATRSNVRRRCCSFCCIDRVLWSSCCRRWCRFLGNINGDWERCFWWRSGFLGNNNWHRSWGCFLVGWRRGCFCDLCARCLGISWRYFLLNRSLDIDLGLRCRRWSGPCSCYTNCWSCGRRFNTFVDAGIRLNLCGRWRLSSSFIVWVDPCGRWRLRGCTILCRFGNGKRQIEVALCKHNHKCTTGVPLQFTLKFNGKRADYCSTGVIQTLNKRDVPVFVMWLDSQQ